MDDASLSLQDYLREGILAADLPDLHPLLSARELLRAFSTLFHGGEESVLVRLLVLRAIGERGQAPDWSPQELREHFAYLDAVKFDTVLGRLRENGLLLWDGASQRYRISPVGRQALAAIGLLLQFNREGDELAYVTAQLAAGQAAGRVGASDLQHLLSRLNELREDFDQAVLSGSEHRIQRAATTLQSVWRWVEKGTAIVQAIAGDAELDAATHRVAQQIGRAQSALLRQASVFQRALNQLDRHRVHLGASGLSSSDVNRYLRDLGADALAALADDALARTLQPAFALAPIALDVAEYELLEREREAQEDQSLPPPQAAGAAAAAPIAEQDYRHAEQWLAQLAALETAAPLADWVPQDGFAVSAYRLSLLGLIGDPGAENRSGVSAAIAHLPLRWRVAPEFEPVQRCGVAYMSRGWLAPSDGAASEADAGVEAGDAPHAAAAAGSAAVPVPPLPRTREPGGPKTSPSRGKPAKAPEARLRGGDGQERRKRQKRTRPAPASATEEPAENA
ncbi:hypothetical protein [Vulcaniibacterium tengchongense]|uniref:Uncharacterized protein n=1 Tax=Vulcaniibacterium tengchongense TaxID=1273429 RepID=A0A3N4V2W2_9GAMM|nr:hypothetical protein [Vulcaniibacterium tengchongense]RPE77312.1 hypothetical protein EDC50_2578 [Vulcaniibacterium tengchongense]